MSTTKPRRGQENAGKKRPGIASARAASRYNSLSHQEFDSLLEFYISSEMRGEEADKLYPAVAEHLVLCRRCRTSYLLVRDAMASPAAEKGARAAQTAVPPLSFLPTAQTSEAWKKLVRSTIGGAPIGFGFAIQRQHVLASLSPTAGPVMRGESTPDQTRLLLADTVVLGQRQVMVEMRTAQTRDPKLVDVRISLVASSPLPDPVHATLNWNQEQRSTVVENGKCTFDGIPVSAIEEGGDIHVEFSAGREMDEA